MVVVNRFTKWSEFLPCHKTITSQGRAELFIKEIFSHHGLPQEVISDWGTQFVSAFFLSLAQALGIKQCLLLAFHPQSDGQTERVNQTVEHYLCCYTANHQLDWVKWLPLAMFTYN